MDGKRSLHCLCAAVVLASFAACGADDNAGPKHDGGPIADGTVAKNCAFSADHACWACAGGSFGEDYQVGCRGQDDCAQFCGPLPSGWQPCDYRGPWGDSAALCRQWPIPPRGTLAGCKPSYSKDFPSGVAYACGFCAEGVLYVGAVTMAAGATTCTWFVDSCTATGYTPVSPDRCP